MPKLTSKGQVTIPVEIRRALGLKPGEQVQFEWVDGQVVLKKNIDENPFEKWEGAADSSKSIEERMEELRGRDGR